jgi:hypothetical protein
LSIASKLDYIIDVGHSVSSNPCLETITASVKSRVVGLLAFNRFNSSIVISYISVEDKYKRTGCASIMVMRLIELAENGNYSVATGRLTTPGKRLFEGMQSKGIITIEEDKDLNYLSFKVMKAG